MEAFGSVYLSAAGVVLLTIAFVQIYGQIRFALKSTKTRGTITSLEGKTFRYKTYFYPRIEYTDQLNRTATFVGGVGSRYKHDSQIGRKLSIRYVVGKDGRHSAKAWTLFSLTAGPLALLALGAICFSIVLFAK